MRAEIAGGKGKCSFFANHTLLFLSPTLFINTVTRYSDSRVQNSIIQSVATDRYDTLSSKEMTREGNSAQCLLLLCRVTMNLRA